MKILLLIVTMFLAFSLTGQKKNIKKNIFSYSTFVLVSKQDMRLYVFDYAGNKVGDYPMSCGRKRGNKKDIDDHRTPEGIFRVSQILDASEWKYGTPDGRFLKGVYGPFFIRLETPGYQGIGIHGTNAPGSISHRVSKGCIRLFNSDLLKLVRLVNPGTVVVVIPSAEDLKK